MTDRHPALARGRMTLSWLYLAADIVLCFFYWTALISGFGLGFLLSIFLIGIPIVWGTLKMLRAIPVFDQRFMTALLSMENEPTYQPPQAVLVTVWQGVLYMLEKTARATLAFMALSILIPLGLFESFVRMFDIQTGHLTARLTYAFTIALLGFQPRRKVEIADLEKAKRQLQEYDAEEEEVSYYVGDDGEIHKYVERSYRE